MIIALLTMVAATGFTGWLYTTERYWGDPIIEQLHELCANGLLILIPIHVAGVIFSSRRHHENLAKSMITGSKRKP